MIIEIMSISRTVKWQHPSLVVNVTSPGFAEREHSAVSMAGRPLYIPYAVIFHLLVDAKLIDY